MVAAVLFPGSLASAGANYRLMPEPATVIPGPGRLVIDANFRIALDGYREPRLESAAIRLTHRLARKSGIPLNDTLVSRRSDATLVLQCEHAGEAVQSMREDESYRLEVTPQQARIEASTPIGTLRGIETFFQLVGTTAREASVPAVRIADRPRFVWRGLMIDVARHWMPIDVLDRNIDAMAAVKLNVLHLHLTDDQGFRVESKLFPRLEELGSDGSYYTQDQLKELVAYARDRGIRIVPEMDMPAHTTSWLVGYPELASAAGPFPIERKWGIFSPALDPTREETFAFLDRLIGEMSAIFPDEYFHIGGDEVNGVEWNTNPKISAFKQAQGIKDNAGLQSYFNDGLAQILRRHQKKMIGWEEILHPGLSDDAIVQSWRGAGSLTAAARAGHLSILSRGYYLDYPRAPADLYRIDPLAGIAGLTPEEKARVLGGEACMWSEFVTPENIDSRIWPAAAAIAERLWSPAEAIDIDSMYERLNSRSGELEDLGVRHRSGYRMMLARLSGPNSPAPLEILADVVQPLNPELREKARNYTSRMAYDRLVDAALPYSEAARIFALQVDHLSANREAVRAQLLVWRDSRNTLLPIMLKSPALEEDIPLAEDLSSVAQAGLEALQYLDSGHPAPEAWADEQTVLLNLAAKPRAELMLMIVEPVSRIVDAARRGSW